MRGPHRRAAPPLGHGTPHAFRSVVGKRIPVSVATSFPLGPAMISEWMRPELSEAASFAFEVTNARAPLRTRYPPFDFGRSPGMW